jgi:hypothetical protein
MLSRGACRNIQTNKTLMALALGVTLGMTTSGVSAESRVLDPYIESALIDVCKSALSNNVLRMNRTIKGYHLKTKTVAMKVMCNGENISNFAYTNGADRTGAKLEKSLGSVSIDDIAMNSSDKLSVYF